ncbi:hypothetical protein [Polymorphospora sp. NPDC050346]|uniref:hypothetical protein n=1 Tax=Polymorphospora sp. NPDC050346 TaxID=3155780 RepID=UPI0033C7E179
MDLTELRLPKGIYARVLGGRDVRGVYVARVVVWADRPYDRCPSCGQAVQMNSDCPVGLNLGEAGGQLQEHDKQHGCGEWLTVDWDEVTGTSKPDSDDEIVPGIGPADVVAAAEQLAEVTRGKRADGRARLEQRLRDDLAAALDRLAEPLAAGETDQDRADEARTGSEVEPGVYREGDLWLAWDYAPGTDDVVTVTADDLVAGRG